MPTIRQVRVRHVAFARLCFILKDALGLALVLLNGRRFIARNRQESATGKQYAVERE
jgi:hypothetical protein